MKINEGEISTRLGLTGIPACAEVIIIERDLRLAKLTDAHYHVSNVSTKDSIDIIKKAKEDGIKITRYKPVWWKEGLSKTTVKGRPRKPSFGPTTPIEGI